jgi:hypothetical protein
MEFTLNCFSLFFFIFVLIAAYQSILATLHVPEEFCTTGRPVVSCPEGMCQRPERQLSTTGLLDAVLSTAFIAPIFVYYLFLIIH